MVIEWRRKLDFLLKKKEKEEKKRKMITTTTTKRKRRESKHNLMWEEKKKKKKKKSVRSKMRIHRRTNFAKESFHYHTVITIYVCATAHAQLK